jgi:hypothetical protein
LHTIAHHRTTSIVCYQSTSEQASSFVSVQASHAQIRRTQPITWVHLSHSPNSGINTIISNTVITFSTCLTSSSNKDTYNPPSWVSFTTDSEVKRDQKHRWAPLAHLLVGIPDVELRPFKVVDRNSKPSIQVQYRGEERDFQGDFISFHSPLSTGYN